MLASLGLRRGEKLVWCGQNSPGVVRVVHAARKVGAVAVPLNYRLTPEEAQYVVDNSDAVMAYVDAEYAPLFAKIRPQTPKLREVLVYDGAPRARPARRRRAGRRGERRATRRRPTATRPRRP